MDDTIQSSQDSNKLSVELIIQMIDFLLSGSGEFLREPLVNEIVEVVDSIGLTLYSFMSLSSFGLFPRSDVKPNRDRINQVLQLLDILVSLGDSNGDNSTLLKKDMQGIYDTVSLSSLSRLSYRLLSFIQGISKSNKSDDYQAILMKCSILLQPVLIKLSKLNLKRTVRSLVGRPNTE